MEDREVFYSRDVNHTCMRISASEAMAESYEVRMLSDQKTDVLLPFHLQSEDGSVFFCYDVTGMLTLDACMHTKNVDAGMVRSVVTAVIRAGRAMEEYLLDPDSLLLMKEYLYVDLETGNIKAAYVPGSKGSFIERLRDLAASLLEAADHEDRICVLLVYDFFRAVRSEDFNMAKLEKLTGMKEAVPEKVPAAVEAAPDDIREETEIVPEKESLPGRRESLIKLCIFPAAGIAAALLIYILYAAGLIWRLLYMTGSSLDEWFVFLVLEAVSILVACIFTVLSFLRFRREMEKAEDMEEETDSFREMKELSCGETVCLGSLQGQRRLVSLNKQVSEDLLVTAFPSVIGSGEDADVKLKATGISRRHAQLEMDEEGMYLTDLESTNGTYVNGRRLASMQRQLILVEDIIAFGDIRFMYCG